MARKLCDECNTELSENAYICPGCGKKQSQSQIFIILVIFIFFILLGFLASGGQDFFNDTMDNTKITNVSIYIKENQDKIRDLINK